LKVAAGTPKRKAVEKAKRLLAKLGIGERMNALFAKGEQKVFDYTDEYLDQPVRSALITAPTASSA
jgi:alpha-D-ribose 1-methylphosphonate 5-triphosphate synthase subunit PhnL